MTAETAREEFKKWILQRWETGRELPYIEIVDKAAELFAAVPPASPEPRKTLDAETEPGYYLIECSDPVSDGTQLVRWPKDAWAENFEIIHLLVPAVPSSFRRITELEAECERLTRKMAAEAAARSEASSRFRARITELEAQVVSLTKSAKEPRVFRASHSNSVSSSGFVEWPNGLIVSDFGKVYQNRTEFEAAGWREQP